LQTVQRNDKAIPDSELNKYAELCTELKLLYVAITRPRNRLIIFDENN
jgi:ATP-dependent exoDNAse (exonuclease V) beta subunit